MYQEIFQWTSVGAAVLSAALWVKASVASVPAPPETQGEGALIGGYVIGRVGGKRVDLIATPSEQAKWNARAAMASAFAALSAAIALALPAPLPAPQLAIAAPPPASAMSATKASIEPKIAVAVKTEHYPLYPSTVPAIFQGSWDEMVSDGCRDREARYAIGATSASNFEVPWDITRIKVVSPTQVDLDVTTKGDDANQVDDHWKIEVLDGGRTLKFRTSKSLLYRKCPVE